MFFTRPGPSVLLWQPGTLRVSQAQGSSLHVLSAFFPPCLRFASAPKISWGLYCSEALLYPEQPEQRLPTPPLPLPPSCKVSGLCSFLRLKFYAAGVYHPSRIIHKPSGSFPASCVSIFSPKQFLQIVTLSWGAGSKDQHASLPTTERTFCLIC